jgi:hypothetical protein
LILSSGIACLLHDLHSWLWANGYYWILDVQRIVKVPGDAQSSIKEYWLQHRDLQRLINPFTKFALLITPIAEAIEDSLHIGKNRTVSCLHQDCLGRQHNNGGACCAVLCLRRRTNWILPQQYGHDVATLCLLPEDHQFKDFHEAGVGAGNLFGYYHYWVGGYWHRHVQFVATDYS